MTTHPFELLLLDDPKQFGLEVEPHLRNFVEQERPAVGPLEGALGPRGRPGKGALFMPEDGALDQPLRHGRAVDGDERPIPPLALFVDRAGHQFFTGPRFALDQHRRAGGSNRADDLEHPSNRLAIAQDLTAPAQARQLLTEGFVLFTETNHLERLRHRDAQRFLTDRLGEIIDGAAPQRHHRVLHRGVSGHDDDRDLMPFLLQLRQQVEAGCAGHPIIRDDELELLPAHGLHRFVDAGGQHRGVT